MESIPLVPRTFQFTFCFHYPKNNSVKLHIPTKITTIYILSTTTYNIFIDKLFLITTANPSNNLVLPMLGDDKRKDSIS